MSQPLVNYNSDTLSILKEGNTGTAAENRRKILETLKLNSLIL